MPNSSSKEKSWVNSCKYSVIFTILIMLIIFGLVIILFCLWKKKKIFFKKKDKSKCNRRISANDEQQKEEVSEPWYESLEIKSDCESPNIEKSAPDYIEILT